MKRGYDEWQRKFAQWQRDNPKQAEKWNALVEKRTPRDLAEQLASAVKLDAPEATRKHGQAVLQKAAQLVPGIAGGSADLDPSTFTYIKDGGDFASGNYAARNIHFGVREHGMGSIVNGLAYDGFFVPYSATFLLFSDYMRPPMRLAAISRLQSIFVFTHDSIFLGEDGPTHQPIEQLACIRAVPNMELWRPADGLETAAAWAAALERKDGPTTLALTRQKLQPLQRSGKADVRECLRGAYALNDVANLLGMQQQFAEAEQMLRTAIRLEPGNATAHFALSQMLFQKGEKLYRQGGDKSAAADITQQVFLKLMTRIQQFRGNSEFATWLYRLVVNTCRDEQRKLIPHGKASLVAVEAAGGHDWYRIIGDGLVIGIDRFGASAPEKALADAYDLTPPKVAGRISKWLNEGARANTKE